MIKSIEIHKNTNLDFEAKIYCVLARFLRKIDDFSCFVGGYPQKHVKNTYFLDFR